MTIYATYIHICLRSLRKMLTQNFLRTAVMFLLQLKSSVNMGKKSINWQAKVRSFARKGGIFTVIR